MIVRMTGVLLIACLAGLAACMQPQRAAPATGSWYPPTNASGDPVAAIFEGRVPCTEPALLNCEKVKVALALYENRQSHVLTTYRLARVYVAEEPQGSRLVVDGAVATARGTKADPDATIIRLDENAPLEFRDYWAVDDNILFLLDRDRAPRVGTAGWSYVLNRTS